MEQVRKTKIICTMGPSTEKEGVLEKLMLAGMNVARFNFSHGDHEEQMGRLTQLRATREKLGLPVAALLDTKGPEIRLREFAEGKVMLEAGQTFTLTTDEIMGDENRVSVSYKDLPKDVAPGTHILIDDGLIEMTVTDVTDTDIICKVINGGKVSNKKGVNVPNVELSMDYVSPKDYKDIVFAVKEDFDFIAASFVRTAADVKELRDILHEHDDKQRVRVLLVRLQAFGQILLECGKTRIVEKYRPLLATLTEHAHGIVLEVGQIQSDQFGNTHAAVKEKRQDAVISLGIRAGDGFQKPHAVVRCKISRQRFTDSRRFQSADRIDL